MVYFLAFLLLAAGLSGCFAFGGLPLPGTLRMASTTEGSYKPVGPAYPVGFMPFLINCILTAPGSLFNSAAISAMVMPSISPLSANLSRIVMVVQHLLNKCIDKFVKSFKKYHNLLLTICSLVVIIIYELVKQQALISGLEPG